ncbi:hypothetical protein CPC08DRAFT_752173 [Agrocybe pediades]|nr:hypothetical protein CPC08DRAFT_752173 [Agrocybe pediades]
MIPDANYAVYDGSYPNAGWVVQDATGVYDSGVQQVDRGMVQLQAGYEGYNAQQGYGFHDGYGVGEIDVEKTPTMAPMTMPVSYPTSGQQYAQYQVQEQHYGACQANQDVPNFQLSGLNEGFQDPNYLFAQNFQSFEAAMMEMDPTPIEPLNAAYQEYQNQVANWNNVYSYTSLEQPAQPPFESPHYEQTPQMPDYGYWTQSPPAFFMDAPPVSLQMETFIPAFNNATMNDGTYLDQQVYQFFDSGNNPSIYFDKAVTEQTYDDLIADLDSDATYLDQPQAGQSFDAGNIIGEDYIDDGTAAMEEEYQAPATISAEDQNDNAQQQLETQGFYEIPRDENNAHLLATRGFHEIQPPVTTANVSQPASSDVQAMDEADTPRPAPAPARASAPSPSPAPARKAKSKKRPVKKKTQRRTAPEPRAQAQAPSTTVVQSDAPSSDAVVVVHNPNMRLAKLLRRLPKEVHLEICKYLGRREFWKWSLVSMSIYRQTMCNRSFWCQILSQVCKQNAVPYSFYPLEPNAYWGIARLLAEWPLRWRWILRKFPKGEVPAPDCVRFFNCQMDKPGEAPRKLIKSSYSMRLVPGGRYLVVGDSRRMAIWDLGMGAGTQSVCLGAVEHDVPKGMNDRRRTVLEIWPSTMIGDFRILVFLPKSGKEKIDENFHDIGTYQMYDVHFPGSRRRKRKRKSRDQLTEAERKEREKEEEEKAKKGKKVKRWKPPKDKSKDVFSIFRTAEAFQEPQMGQYAVMGDLFATLVEDSNVVTVQNIVSGTQERVHISKPWGRVERIMFREPQSIGMAFILIVTMHEVKAYALSAEVFDSRYFYGLISPGPSQFGAQYTVYTNFLWQIQDDATDGEVYEPAELDFPPRWYETVTRPLIIDVTCLTKKAKGKIHEGQRRWRYELVLELSPATLRLSGYVKLLRTLYSGHSVPLRNYGYSDNFIFLAGDKSGAPIVSFGLATEDPELKIERQKMRKEIWSATMFPKKTPTTLMTRIVKNKVGMTRYFELCPVTGRICCFGGGKEAKVMVMDHYTLLKR